MSGPHHHEHTFLPAPTRPLELDTLLEHAVLADTVEPDRDALVWRAGVMRELHGAKHKGVITEVDGARLGVEQPRGERATVWVANHAGAWERVGWISKAAWDMIHVTDEPAPPAWPADEELPGRDEVLALLSERLGAPGGTVVGELRRRTQADTLLWQVAYDSDLDDWGTIEFQVLCEGIPLTSVYLKGLWAKSWGGWVRITGMGTSVASLQEAIESQYPRLDSASRRDAIDRLRALDGTLMRLAMQGEDAVG